MENKIEIEQTAEVIEPPKSGPSSENAPFDQGSEYESLDLTTIMVFIAVNFIGIAQMLNIVGSGAYAQQIGEALGDTTKRGWPTAIITISGSALGPHFSQAADLWGRKVFLIVSSICGFVGCIIMARASSMNMVIAGSVIASISYGTLPLIYAVSSEILPRRYRPIAQGGINAAQAVGGLLALLIGTAMMQYDPTKFRNFWYMTCAFFGASIIPFAFFYNPPPRLSQMTLSFRAKLYKLDWVSFALLTIGIVLFNVGLSWAENPYPWTDAHVLAPLLTGVAFLTTLAWHQIYFKKDGIFNHALFFKDRNMALSLICIWFEGMIFFAANSYFVFEVSTLFNPNLVLVGLRFGITFITAAICAPVAAVYMSATKQIRLCTVLGFLFFVIFNVLMATLNLGDVAETWAYPIFLGIGLGLCLTSVVTAGQLSAPPELIALASGLLISTRFFGGAIAVPIYTAVFNAKISSNLAPGIAAAVLPLGLSPTSLPLFISDLASGKMEGISNIPTVTPKIIQAGVQALLIAYEKSFRYVWIVSGSLSLAALLVSAFVIDPKADFNMHVDAPLAVNENKKT